MHNSDVKRIISQLQRNSRALVDFVSPSVSTSLASFATTVELDQGLLNFTPQARDYAETNGLRRAIQKQQLGTAISGLQGQTYSPLIQLFNDSTVNKANQIINDVLHANLAKKYSQFTNELCKVVGELHDNVSSHSNGVGFSCAQVYNKNEDNSRVELSVADNGRGMQKQVSSFLNKEIEAVESIDWCIQQGNTTWKELGHFAQKDEEFPTQNGYPEGVQTFSSRNHHLGIGLHRLKSLVELCRGNLWYNVWRWRI